MISEISKQEISDTTISDSMRKNSISMQQEETAQQSEINHEKKETEAYFAVNRDGDTLEITGETNNKKIIKEGEVNIKISDTSLKSCTWEKLKILLPIGKISRQQYNKAIRRVKA